MKRIYILFIVPVFLILNYASVFSQDYWVRQPSPTTKWLYRCTFSDSLNGWAAGDSGIVIHTSDGGQNWIIQQTPLVQFIEYIFFLNQRLGWGLCHDFNYSNTTILKTTNGGINWLATHYPDTTLIFNTIYFLDSLTGYLSGYEGIILKTTNAGLNWIRCPVDSNFFTQFPIRDITFFNNQYGYGCGGVMDFSGVVWSTSNYGSNWSAQGVAPEPIYNILPFNDSVAVGTGGDFEFGASIVKTTNAGMNWDYISLNIFGVGQKLARRTSYEMWIPLGFSQRWAVSFDSLKHWETINAPDTTSIYDAIFIDSLRGWAFGTSGSIYKFNYSAIGVIPNSNNLPLSPVLLQNYPNPFNPSTTISYTLPRFLHIRITLFDILGREVKILYDDFQKEGEHKLRFDAEGLASGVYFYKLEAGVFTETKKMVIVK
jgi:photosystem II stability/assembly factor-like uncharacterized protein